MDTATGTQTRDFRPMLISTDDYPTKERIQSEEASWIKHYPHSNITIYLYSSNVNLSRVVYSTGWIQPRSANTLYLDNIKHGNKEVIVNSGLSLKVVISHEEGYYIAFNERFGVYGFGKNRQQAIDDFRQGFVEFYCDIVETPEDELGQSTLEYKKILISFASIITS